MIKFVNCSGVTLEGFTAGHSDGPGFCTGAVIHLKNCRDFQVENCDLYGCGTYGLEIEGTEGFDMFSSNIHDCTYGIMQLQNCEAVHSTHCDFFNNREYALIESRGCVGTVFEDCRFYANWGDAALFSFDREFILMGCAVYHPTQNLGTMNLCEQPGAKNWFSENPFANGNLLHGRGWNWKSVMRYIKAFWFSKP